ncbi:MucR family transcriptional regulator [Novosphingobium album (ex Liu et al. 2023)]|uniref:MucR family transcriptional regulator n=1 Tax=Novosphingobium album (ex Liu et al. 2023) TaxID=3031130 RepID=A0ABT5WQ43_9SPHN|nr:MucR family transcriptional regulator [Novosphingobium album (ex Liu et al. 2023)]MDE8652165.1 MucR family transcriptional regulator [Novosphingobium album (ex Liu et al. 2023)]
MAETDQTDVTALTVQLLSAYLANNTVPSGELPALVQSTRAALMGETSPVSPSEPEHAPAVSVRRSKASPDHLISLIDGKPYKTLKRHLSAHGLTPAEYRARYNLPADYPMVAKAYSEKRRQVANRLGLGHRRLKAIAAATPREASASAEKATAKPKRVSKAKASAAPIAAPVSKPTIAIAGSASVKAKAGRKPADRTQTSAATEPKAAAPKARNAKAVTAPTEDKPARKAVAAKPNTPKTPRTKATKPVEAAPEVVAQTV